jgi:hypothetical protein
VVLTRGCPKRGKCKDLPPTRRGARLCAPTYGGENWINLSFETTPALEIKKKPQEKPDRLFLRRTLQLSGKIIADLLVELLPGRKL